MQLLYKDHYRELCDIVGFHPRRDDSLFEYLAKQVIIDVVLFEGELKQTYPDYYDGISQAQFVFSKFGYRAFYIYSLLTLQEPYDHFQTILFTSIF